MYPLSETGQIVDTVDITLRVSGILRLFSEGKQIPDEADEVLQRAIDFIDAALAGSSVLTGSSGSHAFSGNLSPICWVTDGYLLNNPKVDTPDYREIERFLEGLKRTLEAVRDRIPASPPAEQKAPDCMKASEFFDKLADLLADRADRALSKPSSGTLTTVFA